MELIITQPTRCELHRAYEADYCPICGTAQRITQVNA
jgi:hypothetical protein